MIHIDTFSAKLWPQIDLGLCLTYGKMVSVPTKLKIYLISQDMLPLKFSGLQCGVPRKKKVLTTEPSQYLHKTISNNLTVSSLYE